MRRTIAIAFGISLSILASAGVQAGVSTPTQPEKSSETPTLARFQRDLVNVLALRSEAEPLLGAALLARTLPDPPKFIDFHALITRAAKADDAGPGVAWAQLVDCDAKADACPNRKALATLKEKAPDNAAVWLMVLGQAASAGDEDAERTALAKAAKASRYDGYAGVSLAALAKAADALPPPKNLYDQPHAAADSAAGVRALLVFGLNNFQPLPGFQATARLCKNGKSGKVNKDDKSKVAKDADALRKQCLALARTLVWGSAPLARSLGLHLQQTLSPDASTREQARSARRDLTWQVQSFGKLTLKTRKDAKLAGKLLTLARRGGTRMSLILAALRAQGTPVDAPADWKPQHE